MLHTHKIWPDGPLGSYMYARLTFLTLSSTPSLPPNPINMITSTATAITATFTHHQYTACRCSICQHQVTPLPPTPQPQISLSIATSIIIMTVNAFYPGVSLSAKYQTNWGAVRTILFAWFDHLQRDFLTKKFCSKSFSHLWEPLALQLIFSKFSLNDFYYYNFIVCINSKINC